MNRSGPTRLLLAVLCLASPTSLIAQTGVDVPNWTVPSYRQSAASTGLSPMTDISPGIAFVAMSPCRVFDTRNANGLYGGPRLLANTMRNFDVDSGPCTGIPAGVEAYSMNFGAILPDGLNSFVTIWPAGAAQPLVSTINPIQGGVVANAAIVPAGTGGSISVFPNTGLHLYGDINGYFTDSHNPSQSFEASGSVDGGGVIHGVNTSSTAGSFGVHGEAAGGAFVVTAGVRGEDGGSGYGVWGSSTGPLQLGAGVYGESVNHFGVYGLSTSSTGVFGVSTSLTAPNIVGVSGQARSTGLDSSGVLGEQIAESGVIYGVRGISGSSSSHSAGVLGTANEDDNPVSLGGAASPAGVRGESAGFGVLGISEALGTAGYVVDGLGAVLAYGWVGAVGPVDPGGASPWSFFGNQDIGSPGNKSFVEPHPTDADKIIQYIALEGPEAGTYFRGRARFQNGLATITVPEDFRMVTDPEGLTVQITPMGAMASVGVLRADLNEIVVQSSRNVEFSYLVQGVRRAFKEPHPIRKSSIFAPQGADSRIDETLAPDLKRRLVANGTYNANGTANLETASRLGWDKVWEEKGRPVPQPEKVEIEEP